MHFSDTYCPTHKVFPDILIFAIGNDWTWGNLIGFYLLEFGIFSLILATLGTRRP